MLKAEESVSVSYRALNQSDLEELLKLYQDKLFIQGYGKIDEDESIDLMLDNLDELFVTIYGNYQNIIGDYEDMIVTKELYRSVIPKDKTLGLNLELKRKHNLDLKVEIKSYDMNQDEKIAIFNNVQKIKSFCGFALICNKFVMKKEIIQSNIFFNYAVKLIFKDCIIPIVSK